MPIPPHLHRRIQEVFGADAAEDLVSLLESMDTYRGDIGELRHEMQLGFARIDARFEKVDARFEKVDARFETLEAKFAAAIEKGLREQTRFFFVAWSVILATIIGLYVR
jgi:hypothetical protein